MSNKVFTKSLMRKPLKMLVWALLIFVIGFAVTAKMTEYLVVRGEIERISGYYRAIGEITQSGKQPWEADDNTPVADYIETLDTVAYGQHARGVPGELVGMQNTSLDGLGFYNMDLTAPDEGVHEVNVYLYGTVAIANKQTMLNGPDKCYIVLDVDKVEAGHEEYVHVGDRVTAYYYETEDTPSLDQFEKGGRYFIRAYYDRSEVEIRDYLMMDYLMIKDHLMLGKLDSERWAIPVGADEELDFSAPENAYIGGNIDAARVNYSAMHVIGIKDMSAMPAVQQSVRSCYIAEGRLLNLEDTLEENQVCVVHKDFAERRGLKIGDTITLNLRDFASTGSGRIPAGMPEWKDRACETKTFEIVGLLAKNPDNVYTIEMYVPESCIPSGYAVWSEPFYGYSFVLNSVRDREDFMAENRAAIRDMGFELSFVRDNSDNFLKSADPMIQSASVGALTFGLVALAGLMLTVFVYSRMQRENFAIMRALGVPKRSAVVGFILPALVIGALMLVVSSVVARNYAQGTAAEILSVLSEADSNGSVATVSLLPILAEELGALLVMLAASGLMLSRRPVLELLQGGRAKGRTLSDRVDSYIFGRKDSSGEEDAGEVGKFEGRELEDAPRGSVSMTVPTMRYVMRQIRRTPFKTMLVVVIAAGFVFALGWMRLTVDKSMAEADRIYATTVVEGEIARRSTATTSGLSIINENTVKELEQSDFVENLHLESTQQRYMIAYDDPNSWPYSWNNPDAKEFDMSRAKISPAFVATNNFEKFVERHGIEIEFASYQTAFETGDEEMGKFCPVILHENILAQIGLNVGDIVYVGYSNYGNVVAGSMVIAGTYTGTISITESSFACIIPYNWLKSEAAALHIPITYSIAEFTIATSKNRELDTFREEMTAIVEDPDAGTQDLSLLLWDEELTKVVKPLEQNVRLMSVLYPVIAVLSVIIAAGIAALLVMQVAHETALLRAVGLKRKRVLVMNIVQMAIPCAVGIICGFAAVLALEGDSIAGTLGVGSICAAAYLAGAVAGSMAASLAVLKRRPMQLLQINE